MRQIFKAKAKQILRVSVFVIHNRCELKKTHYTLNEAEVIKMVCTFVKGKKKKNKNVSSAKKKKKTKESQLNQYFVAYWKELSGIWKSTFWLYRNSLALIKMLNNQYIVLTYHI